jgi:hypothetical protein
LEATMKNLIEPVPVDDDLCTRLALIEDLGFAARFVLVHDQTCYEANSTMCVVRRKIVLPYAEIPPGIEMALGFMARRAALVAGHRLLRLVR